MAKSIQGGKKRMDPIKKRIFYVGGVSILLLSPCMNIMIKNSFIILGSFRIRNSETQQYLSFKQLKLKLSDTAGSKTKWTWVPKEGGHEAWGYIHNTNNRYLSIGKCPDNEPCTLKLQNFGGGSQ